MSRILFIILTLSLLSSEGCQNDSDYRLGAYTVVTTVTHSSCPSTLSQTVLRGAVIPGGTLPGQSQTQEWHIQRTAISGSGTETIILTITSNSDADESLSLQGEFDAPKIQIAEQKNPENGEQPLYRFIVISGHLEEGRISGEIHTFLSEIGATLDMPLFLITEFPCEITETFTGANHL